MGKIFGLDCEHCKHDDALCYRVRTYIMQGDLCSRCGNQGKVQTQQQRLMSSGGLVSMGRGDPNAGTGRICYRCNEVWTEGVYKPAGKDCVYQPHQLESAQAQLYNCGVDGEREGDFEVNHANDKRKTLPFWAKSMRIHFHRENMPRAALYFRGFLQTPEGGVEIDPDKIFQLAITPDMNKTQRAHANEIRFPPEMCKMIRRGVDKSYSAFNCQFCGKPVALRAFSTTFLREVEMGD